MMRSLVLFVALLSSSIWASDELQPEAYSGISDLKGGTAQTSMVVAAHPLAAEAGYQMLQLGGSAVDAAIAIQLALTLVEPQSSGIGGGAFMLHYDAELESLVMLDGRETAPMTADGSLFLEENGDRMGFWKALIGGRSVGVPGVLAMMAEAHEQHGKLPWETLFEPTIKLAEEGFVVSPRLHLLLSTFPYMDVNPAIKAYFYDSDGEPWPVGFRLKNPDYANTLKLLASEGVDVFYRGQLAEEIVAAVQSDSSSQGLLTLADMQAYQPVERLAVCAPVWDYEVCSAAPPSSGGVTLLQQLSLVERQQADYSGPLDPLFIHHFTAASNLAFADRNMYLADSDFVEVPVAGLLAPDYLDERAELITSEALVSARAGVPDVSLARAYHGSPSQPSTTHFSVVDAEGNVVSMTSSIEMGFGSRVMVGGFLLNNQLTDFDFVPINADGELVANRVQPGKRPRSSMSPTIVFLDGKPVLSAGSPGGSRIINYTAQAIANVLLFNLTPEAAVAVPHIVARNTSVLELESPGIDAETIDTLEQQGYRVQSGFQNSGLHLIKIGSSLEGGADPRREGVVRGE